MREEIEAYVKGNFPEAIFYEQSQAMPQVGPSRCDDDLVQLEQKYQAALKKDEQVKQQYESHVREHGEMITLEDAAGLLKMSRYAVSQKNFQAGVKFPSDSSGNDWYCEINALA